MPNSASLAPRAALVATLDAQAHAYSRIQLLSRWSRHELDAAVRAGQVVRVLRGVYCGAKHSRDPVVIGEAVTTWAPRGVLTGELALILFGVKLRMPSAVDVVTANGDPMHPPAWVRVHQLGIPAFQSSPRRVRCTTPQRALLDAWRFASPERRTALFYEALWVRVCAWEQLERELDRTPRVAGRDELERILGWFAEGATSPLEVRAKHETFADARFREFEWQAPVTLRTRKAKVDMLHRLARVAVELDGDAYHATREARDADRTRQNALAAAGYVTVRFGWRDIVDRPEWCRRQVLDVVAARLREVA